VPALHRLIAEQDENTARDGDTLADVPARISKQTEHDRGDECEDSTRCERMKIGGRYRLIHPLAPHEKALKTANEIAYPTTKVAKISVIGTASGRLNDGAMRAPRLQSGGSTRLSQPSAPQ
jgi:hypothetical protein